jgi:hypothetical protein
LRFVDDNAKPFFYCESWVRLNIVLKAGILQVCNKYSTIYLLKLMKGE